MKHKISSFIMLAICSARLFAAEHPSSSGTDTLILNDGKIITGAIAEKSFEVYNNMQVNLNTGNTFINEGSGKDTKVPNSNIHYFLFGGKKYINHEMTGGHKIMEVISEGKANLYYWAGQAGVPHTTITTSPGATTYTSTENMHSLALYVLVVKGKNYTPHGKFLEKHFEEFFGDCPSLVKESKAGGYDYGQIVPIVKKYNTCK